MSTSETIVPGIVLNSSGQAAVEPAMAKVLFDLAMNLEGPTSLPVDVEHALAAIVLAARNGELDSNTPVSADDPRIIAILKPHVRTVFSDYGGQVGTDD